MSKEIGTIGMGATRVATETKSSTSSSYQPMFSISKEGNLSQLRGDTMNKHIAPERKLSALTPFKAETAYFSKDTFAPKNSPKDEVVLYQRREKGEI